MLRWLTSAVCEGNGGCATDVHSDLVEAIGRGGQMSPVHPGRLAGVHLRLTGETTRKEDT